MLNLEHKVETDSHSTSAVQGGGTDEADFSTVPKVTVNVDAISEEIATVSVPNLSKVSNNTPRPEPTEETPNFPIDSGSGRVRNVSPTLTSSESPVVIQVSKKMEGVLFKLRAEFMRMFQEVERSMEAGQQSGCRLKDLKQTMTDTTDDDAFERCEDYSSLFDTLRSHVNMFDPHVLSGLAATYGDDNARSHTERYEEYLEKFMHNTIIRDLEGELEKFATQGCSDTKKRSPVIMKLPPRWRDRTLKDLSDFAQDLFADKSEALKVPIEVKKGYIHVREPGTVWSI